MSTSEGKFKVNAAEVFMFNDVVPVNCLFFSASDVEGSDI